MLSVVIVGTAKPLPLHCHCLVCHTVKKFRSELLLDEFEREEKKGAEDDDRSTVICTSRLLSAATPITYYTQYSTSKSNFSLGGVTSVGSTVGIQ
jgi:hypothetical protein